MKLLFLITIYNRFSNKFEQLLQKNQQNQIQPIVGRQPKENRENPMNFNLTFDIGSVTFGGKKRKKEG